jgi:hypothetical protein
MPHHPIRSPNLPTFFRVIAQKPSSLVGLLATVNLPFQSLDVPAALQQEHFIE